MAEVGFKGLTPHCTRHNFATQAKRCGMDDMGHSLNDDVTESVYAHTAFDDLKHEMNKLDFTVRTYL